MASSSPAATFFELLKSGGIGWLMEKLGIDVALPEKWDLASAGTFFLDVLGLTWNSITGKLEKLLKLPAGMIDKLAEYVEPIRKVISAINDKGVMGAITELIEQGKEALENFSLKDFLAGLVPDIIKDLAIEATKTYLPQIIAMFIPAGAIAKLIDAVVKGVNWVIEQKDTLMELFTSVRESVTAVAKGDLSGVIAKVYETLKGLIKPALALLAKQVGIESLLKPVKTAIKKIKDFIAKIVDKIVAWLAKLAEPFVDAVKGLISKVTGVGDKGDPEDLKILSRVRTELEDLRPKEGEAMDYESVVSRKKIQAKEIEKRENDKLKPQKKKLDIIFSSNSNDRADGDIDFKITIVANNAEGDGRIVIEGAQLRDLTPADYANKPWQSPTIDKWKSKGGEVKIEKATGTWVYTDWEGNTVAYPGGYPDFKTAGFVLFETDIDQIPDYDKDYEAANKKLGREYNPKTERWHHHQNGKTMQLIPEKIHTRFRHEGGVAAANRRLQQ